VEPAEPRPPAPQPAEPRADAARPRRRMSRRNKRLAVASAIVIVALVAAFWGAQPQEFVTPSQLAGNPSRYAGTTIQLRGLVTELNTTAGTFLVGDDIVNVTVEYTSLPEAFQVGKEVIVKGQIATVSPLVFTAQEIVVGHAR